MITMLTSEQFNESSEGRRQKKTQQKHTMRTPHKLRQPRNSPDDLRDICSFFFCLDKLLVLYSKNALLVEMTQE